MSTAASNSYLTALTPPGRRAVMNSRLESTTWTTAALGPPVGGLLVTATSPVISAGVDATSFLLSALGWRRIRHRETPPAPAGPRHTVLAETVAGWHYIFAHRTLRALFVNAVVL